MKTTKRELRYASEHFGEVYHTTLNPEGPGVVRIHLVPPAIFEKEVGASVAIINGQDVIPVNRSWSILLMELINEINKYSGRPINEEDLSNILDRTAKSLRRVYPMLGKKRIRRDAFTIMSTFDKVARGLPVTEPIEYVTMGEYAPFMRAPHRMDLMVSAMTRNGLWHCNQKCVHCYAAGQALSEEAELSTDDWKRIIDKCRAALIPQLTFTGGEPTLREDLVELVEYAKWFITRLNTNGILLTKELTARLKAASLDSVQVTFYSSDEAIHNALVGAAHYADTVRGIENALDAGLSLSVNTPLCTLNRDYVKSLEFLHEKGVIYVTCSGLITTGNAAGEASERLQLTHEEIAGILTEAAHYCHENGMEISFTSPGWVSAELCRELGISTPTCGACLSNMAVTPGGSVVPCQSWLFGKPLGNMLTDEWADIWNGEACAARREFSAAMTGECPLRIHRQNGKEDA